MQKNGRGQFTRIYDKFECYSLGDCACEFCIHYKGKSTPCDQEVCCCASEKAEALRQEIEEENRLAAASVPAKLMVFGLIPFPSKSEPKFAGTVRSRLTSMPAH